MPETVINEAEPTAEVNEPNEEHGKNEDLDEKVNDEENKEGNDVNSGKNAENNGEDKEETENDESNTNNNANSRRESRTEDPLDENKQTVQEKTYNDLVLVIYGANGKTQLLPLTSGRPYTTDDDRFTSGVAQEYKVHQSALHI